VSFGERRDFQIDGKIRRLERLPTSERPLVRAKLFLAAITCPWHGYQIANTRRVTACRSWRKSRLLTSVKNGRVLVHPQPTRWRTVRAHFFRRVSIGGHCPINSFPSHE
jgi:hypothetical protein